MGIYVSTPPLGQEQAGKKKTRKKKGGKGEKPPRGTSSTTASTSKERKEKGREKKRKTFQEKKGGKGEKTLFEFESTLAPLVVRHRPAEGRRRKLAGEKKGRRKRGERPSTASLPRIFLMRTDKKKQRIRRKEE